ncbi:hypothetical protein Bbelb_379910 [Branchiostoma belcheri]|nr:hypothetical protein Bbelb_379910 [Branchiostoma belcheri]
MSSIPLSGLGLFISIITIKIDGNPWQCDCRMTPFRLNLAFNEQIVCTQPDKVKGQKLTDVNPEELICEEPTISTLTSPRTITSDKPTQTSPLTTPNKPKSVPSNTLSVLIGVSCGSLPGLVLTGIIILTVWYKIKTRIPPLGLHPIGVSSRTSGHDQTRQDQTQISQCIENLSQAQVHAALNPNPMYESVGTPANDVTSAEVPGCHDQAGQIQSQTITDTNATDTIMTNSHCPQYEDVDNDDSTIGQGQRKSFTESDTNTTTTIMINAYTDQSQPQTITESNTNTTATVMTSGYDQTGQDQSQTITESNTNTTATVIASGHD